MIDARNIYRKVTRKIYDFSPEQEQNLLAIVWLYRGQTERFLGLVASYCHAHCLRKRSAVSAHEDDDGNPFSRLPAFFLAGRSLSDALQPFLITLAKDAPPSEIAKELDDSHPVFAADVRAFKKAIAEATGGLEEPEDHQWGAQRSGGAAGAPGRNQPRPRQADGPALQARLPAD